MKKWIHSTSENINLEDIMCMSDVRGKNIKVENNVPFSFYYSAKNSSHGPRVKVTSDPNKIKMSKTGNLKLTGDWSFVPGEDDDRINSKLLDTMRGFFRKYLVMFLLIWDKKSEDEPSLSDYMEGDITLNEFIKELNFYHDYSESLDKIKTVEELEKFCRDNNLVNFYGN